MKYLLSAFAILLMFSCTEIKVKHELEETKLKLNQTEMALKEVQAASELYPLVHLVYLDIKEDADTEALMTALKTLEDIPQVHQYEIGKFESLGDERAMSNYEIVLSMAFMNEDAYTTYQADSIHLALKSNLKTYLAAPPATYDYLR